MSKTDTRLDVLVTFYNQEKYVDRALESVFSQQCNFNFNVLIGDDGSTDATLEKVKKWSNRFPGRIFVYSMKREANKKYIGGFRASQNRLHLLDKVQSEYFIFLDGDDYFTDVDKFQTQINILDDSRNSDCVACSHDIWAVYPDGKKEIYIKNTLKQGKVDLKKYWCKYYFHTDTIIVRSSVIPHIHKKLLINNFNDNMITFDIIQNGKIYYLPKAMAAYDQNGEGIWTGEKQLINNLRNMFLYDLCLIINPNLKFQSMIRFYQTWKWFHENKEIINKNDVESLLQEADDRRLVYSLMWINVTENETKLTIGFYKIFFVDKIIRIWMKLKKWLVNILYLEKKIIKKLIRFIPDLRIQNIYKKNIYYESEKRIELNGILSICKKHGNELNVEISDVYENKDGIVTIISDDGDFETSKKLNVLAQKHKLPMTVAGSVINVAPHIDHWKNLLREGKIELVNHSYNHFRMDDDWKYSEEEIRYRHEIIDAETFFKNQFNIQDKVFVCPENAISKLGYKVLLDDGMVAVRRGTRGVNSLHPKSGVEPGDWFNLKCYGIMDPPQKLETRKQMRKNWLEEAAQGNWLIEMWHNVDIDGYQTISYEDAESHLMDINLYKQRLWCAKFTDVVKYLMEKEEAKIYSWCDNGKKKVIIIVEKNNSILHELTINIDGKFYNIIPNILYCVENEKLKKLVS